MKINTIRLLIKAGKTLISAFENELKELIKNKSDDKEIEDVKKV